jgi:hypothetical protein
VIWLCRIARSLLAILRQPIAKQAMPFGNHLSLKKRKRFGNILSLNTCWQLGNEQLLSVRKLFVITYCLTFIGDFGNLLLLKQKQ